MRKVIRFITIFIHQENKMVALEITIIALSIGASCVFVGFTVTLFVQAYLDFLETKQKLKERSERLKNKDK
jgi:hypothetical protein